jgi:hypothetical protein
VCQAVRAPGSNRTQAERMRAGSGAWMMGSCQTVPVKLGAPILREGRDPQAMISMEFLPNDAVTLLMHHFRCVTLTRRRQKSPALPPGFDFIKIVGA